MREKKEIVNCIVPNNLVEGQNTGISLTVWVLGQETQTAKNTD